MNDEYTDWLRRLAWHESGHQVIAKTLGWELGGVTVRGGETANGCGIVEPPLIDVPPFDHHRPFVQWPAAVRANIEQRTLICLAGDLASVLRGAEPQARVLPSVSEQAVDLTATLPDPEPAQDVLTSLRELVDASYDPENDEWNDAAIVARMATIAHVGDHASQAAFVGYMTTQCQALVIAERPRIEKLADWLAVRDTLSGIAVASMLDAS